MSNYKIKVNNEAESKEAQELFFELGFIFRTGLGVKHLDCKFLYARNGIIEVGYDSNNFECSANKEATLDQLRNLVAEKKNGLLTPQQAKLAWANGESLQIREAGSTEWKLLTGEYMLMVFDYDRYELRLKPRTITLNGIEIPAPFEPKKGEGAWCLDGATLNGYKRVIFDDFDFGIGFWRTEEQIKQVVTALRGVLK